MRRRGNGVDAAKHRAEAEAKLREVRGMTPHLERLAPSMNDLTPDEFAARVVRAFGRSR